VLLLLLLLLGGTIPIGTILIGTIWEELGEGEVVEEVVDMVIFNHTWVKRVYY